MAIIWEALKQLWKLLGDYPALWLVVLVLAVLALGWIIRFVKSAWAGLMDLHRGVKRLTVWFGRGVRWCRDMKGLPARMDTLSAEVAILRDLVEEPSKEELNEAEDEDA